MIARYIFPGEPEVSVRWDAKYRTESPATPDPSAYDRQAYVQTLLRYLTPGQRILDAGCGAGGLLAFLRARGHTVVGIDTSETAVAIARRASPAAEISVGNIEALPFPNAAFEAYVAIGSWEYVQSGPARLAAEARRVLTEEGIALIEVPAVNTLRRFLYLPLKKTEGILRTLGGRQPQFAHYFFTKDEMQRLLKDAGFEILHVQPHDLPEPDRHYGLWVDWPFLRANQAKSRQSKRGAGRSGAGSHYELNAIGRLVKRLGNALSPWTISTGMVMVARKK